MKIRGIHIDGFGKFAGRQFNPLSPGMTVFFGPNEAGKSSLLAFLQVVLYGFPVRGRNEHYPPLNGGTHGGRLWLDCDGRLYVVQRRAEKAGKDLSLTLPDGSETASEETLRQLLGGASREVYTNVFAFSLGELQALESLAGDEVSAQVYSAGIGAGAVPGALASLKRREEELFKKQGRTHAVAGLGRELDEVEAALDARRRDDETYASLRRRLEEVSAGAEASRETVERLRSEQLRNQRMLEAWPEWARAQELRRELEASPASNVTAEVLEDLRWRLRERDEARTGLNEARVALEGAESRRDSIAVDRTVLATAADVRSLEARLKSYEASLHDLPRRQEERAGLARALEEALAELGPGWTPERAVALDTSGTARAAITAIQEQMTSAQAALEQATARLEAATGRVAEAGLEHDRAVEALDALPTPALSAEELQDRRALLEACRTAAAESFREGQGAASPAPLVPALMAAGAATGGIALGYLAWSLAGAIAAAIVVGAAGLASVAWRTRNQRVESGGGIALRRYRALLDEAQLEPHQVEGALAEVDREERKLTEVARQAAVVAEKQVRLDEMQRAREAAHVAVDAAARGLDDLEHRWQTDAGIRGLPPGIQPLAAVELLNQARMVRERAATLEAMDHRVRAIQRDITDYEADVAATARNAGVEPGTVNAAATTNELSERLREAQRNATALEQCQKVCAAAASALDRETRRAEEAERAQATLLDEHAAADVAALRALGEVRARRDAQATELASCETALARAGGSGERLDDFIATLAGTDPDALALRLDTLQREMSEATAKHEAALDEQGSLKRQLAEVTGSTGTSALLARREAIRAELAEVAVRWTELRLARSLIETARARYEKERQPRVIQAAGEYFREMTLGRYSHILAPLGEQTVRVVDRDGASKSPGQLSRGTREQLYLALRFGLIDQFAERGGALPIAVDEVLVNFDEERARAAAAGFARLARRHQVLVFTCHQWVVDLFTNADPGAATWSLESAPGTAPVAGAGTRPGAAP